MPRASTPSVASAETTIKMIKTVCIMGKAAFHGPYTL
jgi:hypothetical protein